MPRPTKYGTTSKDLTCPESGCFRRCRPMYLTIHKNHENDRMAFLTSKWMLCPKHGPQERAILLDPDAREGGAQ